MLCGFELEAEWIADIMQHLGESDLQSALRTRTAIQEKLKRAEDLYIDGELDRRKYSRIREEADVALLSVHVPQFDDASHARQLLADFGAFWLEMSVNRKNSLLRQLLDAIYVDLDTRRVVALVPKGTFTSQVITMGNKAGVPVVERPQAVMANC